MSLLPLSGAVMETAGNQMRRLAQVRMAEGGWLANDGDKLLKSLKEDCRDPIARGTWGIFAACLVLAAKRAFLIAHRMLTSSEYFVMSGVLEAGHSFVHIS
jgi:hypothetical protein